MKGTTTTARSLRPMKALTLVLASALIGLAGFNRWAQHRHSAELESMRAARKAERAALLAENARLRSLMAKDPSLAPAAASRSEIGGSKPPSPSSPEAILQRLQQIRLVPGEPPGRAMRQIHHQLGCLIDAGPAAVPGIRSFLALMQDVDYRQTTRAAPSNVPGSGENRPPGSAAAGPIRPGMDWEFPPSLRLALVDVLREVGNVDAEAALAEFVTTTGRGVEVAYGTRALQALAPDKYRAVTVQAAKELLRQPPRTEPADPLDANARGYLFGVLEVYGDTSFAAEAQTMLITSAGKIDSVVLQYLLGTLKDQAFPAIRQAYADPRLRDPWEQAALASRAAELSGHAAQVNEMVHALLVRPDVPAVLKAALIAAVAGAGGGPIRLPVPQDPELLSARIQLLESARRELTEERLQAAIDRGLGALKDRVQGRPSAEEPFDPRVWLGGNDRKRN